ncbi:uncharacterized protein LOC143826690 isoform X2 [Paroedura picta]|uniref:uncharacterized protein LOC143826690 isoform X2 n=1 Tax=Paroedura picta TaxID=143630 RepID=UPI00405676EF
MVSIMGFLMYSWILLPLLTADEKYGGNADGQPCVFPFAYKDKIFYSCTNKDEESGRFWCATTGSYNKIKKWSYCADTRLHANHVGSCVFPFIYKGKCFSSCTTAGTSGGKLWCSLTSNYDINPKWTYCDPSEHHPCHFPFIYKGKSYSACTRDGDGDGQLWCATTANYDTDVKWKACSQEEYEGNSKGQACVFPFTYRNRTFYSCTNENTEDGRFWCATTGNYDKDKKWSYCADTRQHEVNMGPCIFPFIFGGKTYSSCTTTGASTGKLWCSLSSNYDMDPKWTYCDASEHHPCHFPFIYKGKSYSACTRDGDGDGQLWCATTANYDTDVKWKACSQEEYEGNSKGQACVFPFAYRNRTFYSCTNENTEDGRFWCATTGNYDKDKKWSYCADTRQHEVNMGPCIFPFIFGGKTYSSCTTTGASTGKLWCSLSSNYDMDPKWTYCDASEHHPCHFPFIYKGKSYSACTRDGDGDGQLWCATTANYDTDVKWKACSQEEYEGNSKGQACVFPFAYRNRTFYSCTNENTEDGRFWCATTGNYDKDKKWSYCADTRQHEVNMGPCIFPFIFGGKTYSSCTTTGASTGKLWCSLSSNYDMDPKWTYCDASEPSPCHFPFIFKGKSYSACTKDGAGDGQLWCATTADYDKDRKWKACALQEYEGNSNGQTCVFPFIYKNRIFYTCTNEDTKDGRFWCANTGNYDEDKKWSYCADTRLDSSPTGPCVFPFIFKGKTYLSCTTDETPIEQPWCSLTGNYDVNPKRTYCETSGVPQHSSDDHEDLPVTSDILG